MSGMTQTMRPLPEALEVVAGALPGASAGDWFVLHAKPRQEKVLAEDLAAQDVAHYLPLKRCVRYYGPRKAIVHEPLFPGYVFLRGTVEAAYREDRAGRLASIIRVVNQRQLQWELENLHLALVSQAPLAMYPYLKAGVRVAVRSGPFMGLQGVIEDRTKSERLILKIDMLGQAVAMEIDGSLLEVVD